MRLCPIRNGYRFLDSKIVWVPLTHNTVSMDQTVNPQSSIQYIYCMYIYCTHIHTHRDSAQRQQLSSRCLKQRLRGGKKHMKMRLLIVLIILPALSHKIYLCFVLFFFLSSSAKHKDSIPKVFNKKDGSTSRGWPSVTVCLAFAPLVRVSLCVLLI